jgi:ketosteroid isomerase-like protein
VIAWRVLASLVGLVLLSALASASDPQKEVEAIVDGFQASLRAGDRTKALGFLDEKVAIFEAGGAELSRDEYGQHHLAGDMEFVGATANATTRRVSDVVGDAAWVTTLSTTSGEFRGKKISTRNAETMILRRSSAGWRIVHIHWSSRAAAEKSQ